MSVNNLEKLAKLLRYFSLVATTQAKSGHPTSSLSAADLLAGLMFGGFFRFDVEHPENPNNDRLIFSKGHASPLFYALWAAAGAVSEEELLSLRQFGSRLEGHPSMTFPFTEVATGSLGQGLSVGVGMALNAKYLDKLLYRTYVLLGDSEMAEGSVWEALQIAAHYKLDNLVGILDVNRLGQRGQTMYGSDLKAYEKRVSAFGWRTIVVNGHNLNEILKAYKQATPTFSPPISQSETGGEKRGGGKPVMIIAKTLKGKGISIFEDRDNWHGKALSADELKLALTELGEMDKSLIGQVARPEVNSKFQNPNAKQNPNPKITNYDSAKPVATRKAYGNALAIIGADPRIVVLDAEVSNSTFADIFKAKYPERFFEMYIAEQNMVGAALGLSRRGKIPFVSTFAAFFTRAFDQIRMSQYSGANIKFVGSHAGVSIGEDGASQMGLEDLAMFRTIRDGVVLYPSDAVSTEKLVAAAARHQGIVYIRTTRKDTPIIYNPEERFVIGGSKMVRQSARDAVTVLAAGITLHEALRAYEELHKEGISIRVIDLYSVKPLDTQTLYQAAKETKALVTVEDHYPEGGLGEAVRSALAESNAPHPPLKVRGGEGELCRVYSLAVRRMPKSGKPDELLAYEEISAGAIIKKVREVLGSRL